MVRAAAGGRATARDRADRASIGPMEAILFDWDGTLVDSLGAFHAANAAVMARVRPAVRRRALSPQLRPRLARDVPPARRPRRSARGGERALGDGLRRRRRHRPGVPGAAEALERLRDAGADARDRDRRPSRGRRAPARADRARRAPRRSGSSATTCRSTSPTRSRSGGRSGSPATAIGRRHSAYVGDAPTDMQMARRRRRSGDRDRIGPRRSGRAPRRPAPHEVAPSVAAWVERAPRRGRGPGPAASSARPADDRAHALVLADGDASSRRPTSTRPGRAGPTGSTSSSPPTAAPGMRPRLGRPIDRWVGDGDSIDAGGARAARRGRRPDRPRAGRQGRDGRGARAARRDRGRSPRRITILGALGGPAARPRARRTSGCSPTRPSPAARSCLLGRAEPDPPAPARVGRISSGAVGDLVSLLPFGGDGRRDHDRPACATRSATSRSGRAVARPVERARGGATPRLTAPDPAGCSSWRPLLGSRR